MQNDTCPTCGKTPHYPFLKNRQRQYTTLCGRDTVQYNNSMISQEMLERFLKTHHIQYKQNPYMIVFHSMVIVSLHLMVEDYLFTV